MRAQFRIQSYPWVGSTRGVGLVRLGRNGPQIFVFCWLGWVVGVKWQISEQYMRRVYRVA